MARGTQHRKRRPAANARAAAVAAPKRQRPPQWQDELFFNRLRNHAKWAYVGLAVAFILGFVLLGVGSGSTGVSDVLQNAFNFGSGSGTSISSLQKKTEKNPSDSQAWRDLATALEGKQRTQEAVTALQRYTALRPQDQSALQELATQSANAGQILPVPVHGGAEVLAAGGFVDVEDPVVLGQHAAAVHQKMICIGSSSSGGVSSGGFGGSGRFFGRGAGGATAGLGGSGASLPSTSCEVSATNSTT